MRTITSGILPGNFFKKITEKFPAVTFLEKIYHPLPSKKVPGSQDTPATGNLSIHRIFS